MNITFFRFAPGFTFALSLVLFALPGHAALGQVRISQVYGGGGNNGAFYKCDYVELFNAGPHAITLDGWSIQYASSSGTAWQKTRLTGMVAPYSWFLIQEAAGTGAASALPSPDARGSIAMSATAGKIALVADTAVLAAVCPGGPPLVDLVGFGPATHCHEGAGPAPAPGNTTALFRKGGGLVETGDNAADFETAAPAPRNSGAPPLAVAPDQAPPCMSPARPGLIRNYPNPFNPSTTFEFTVARPARTTLRLYDLLGEEVACLFDGPARPASRHRVAFHAGSLPAGVYLARLCAGPDCITIAAVLLK